MCNYFLNLIFSDVLLKSALKVSESPTAGEQCRKSDGAALIYQQGKGNERAAVDLWSLQLYRELNIILHSKSTKAGCVLLHDIYFYRPRYGRQQMTEVEINI